MLTKCGLLHVSHTKIDYFSSFSLIISTLMNIVQMRTASLKKKTGKICIKLFKITCYCIIASFVFAFSLDSSIVPEHHGQAHISTVT